MQKRKKIKKLKIAIIATLSCLVVSLITFYICQTILTKPEAVANITNTQPTITTDNINKKPTNPTLSDPSLPKATALPILMYHFFYDSSTGAKGEDNNWIDTKDFEDHIKYLADNQYYYPTWDEVKQFINGEISLPEKSIVITADDGNPSFFSLAVPILAKYKVPATSFLITSWTNPKDLNVDKSLITFESHSNNMHQGGCNGGHGGLFRCIDHQQALNDLAASRQAIGGGKVFCYPFGDYTDQSIEDLQEAGFEVAVTTNYGKAQPGDNPLLLPRIRISQSTNIATFIDMIK
jgi:peptidoglycan/xylan/chitin deacetylase (PgdA/CDA1 family)